eukprot:EC790243.1.p5 GENE.EC790243.1~~EC790243.1.p5  ORF type:complete len:65 (-),score=10.13 EC790243.1:13-207(-)
MHSHKPTAEPQTNCRTTNKPKEMKKTQTQKHTHTQRERERENGRNVSRPLRALAGRAGNRHAES